MGTENGKEDGPSPDEPVKSAETGGKAEAPLAQELVELSVEAKREQARASMRESFLAHAPGKARQAAEQAGLSPEDQKELAIGAFHELLGRGKLYFAKELLKAMDLGPEVFKSPETQEVVRESIPGELGLLRVAGIRQMVEASGIPLEQLRTPELKKQAAAAMLKSLEGGSVGTFEEIKDLFDISKEVSASPEVIAAARAGIKTMIDKHARGVLSEASRDQSVARLEQAFGISRNDPE